MDDHPGESPRPPGRGQIDNRYFFLSGSPPALKAGLE